jgi:type II secretory pathway pseudopilin PulG
MSKTDQKISAFTLIELLVTAGLTALIMMSVTSLFISFLMTATKNRLSQSVRETGTSAMNKMTELLRNASSIDSVCGTQGQEMVELSLIGADGLTTTLREEGDKIASSSAFNGESYDVNYFLTQSDGGEENDHLTNLLFTCYDTELGPKYVEIGFTLSTSNSTENSPSNSNLDFHSGVSLRN